jgi:hypothetical protein
MSVPDQLLELSETYLHHHRTVLECLVCHIAVEDAVHMHETAPLGCPNHLASDAPALLVSSND